MSEIKTDKLTGTTTAGSILVTGETDVTVTTNLQQGLAKVWCAFNTVTNHSTFDSFNSSGLTDNGGSGDTTISFTNNMRAAKSYIVTGVMADASDVTNAVYSSQPKQDDSVATSSLRVVHAFAQASSAGVGDIAYNCNVIHGDLA